jgi:hypothetical protein
MVGQVRTAKVKYHITNPTTGEIEEFETTVDIDLLEEYNGWVIENKLNPPTYSPQEYAKYLELKQAKDLLAKVREYISDAVEEHVLSGLEVLENVREMLNNEK